MGTDDLFKRKKQALTRNNDKKKVKMSKSMMIVCEGEKTEPNYFKSFSPIGVEVLIQGEGKNTKTLLNEAIRLWEEKAKNNEIYESLWIVMDKDSFPQEYYNECFLKYESIEKKLNKKYKNQLNKSSKITINIAYSNEAFELWYLLHFVYWNRGISRTEFKKLLTKRLGKEYKKNDPKIYDVLQELGKKTNNKQGQDFAMKNAKKLRKLANRKVVYNSNPSTSVDVLVEELNTHLKE